MKNQVIELYEYRDCAAKVNSREKHFPDHRTCRRIAAIADTVMSLSISVCTIFCMYLAYTML